MDGSAVEKWTVALCRKCKKKILVCARTLKLHVMEPRFACECETVTGVRCGECL